MVSTRMIQLYLTPMHRGVAGTQKLNHDLQQMLNNNYTWAYNDVCRNAVSDR